MNLLINLNNKYIVGNEDSYIGNSCFLGHWKSWKTGKEIEQVWIFL